MRKKFRVSERRACCGLGVSRSSVRYCRREKADGPILRQRLRKVARALPRFGYRQMTRLLRLEGFRVSFKRIHRLWRLKVQRKPKRNRGRSTNSCSQLKAERINYVWSWDFVFARTVHGQPLKWFTIIDEYTRRCITLDVGRTMTSEKIIDRLAELFVMYGVPESIRSDNGPEFVSRAIESWLRQLGLETLYIEPGSPWQNGYAESFNSRLRDELLNREELDNPRHVRAHATAWREDYNDYRPHSTLGGLPPNHFTRRCADSVRATPSLH